MATLACTDAESPISVARPLRGARSHGRGITSGFFCCLSLERWLPKAEGRKEEGSGKDGPRAGHADPSAFCGEEASVRASQHSFPHAPRFAPVPSQDRKDVEHHQHQRCGPWASSTAGTCRVQFCAKLSRQESNTPEPSSEAGPSQHRTPSACILLGQKVTCLQCAHCAR